MHVGAATHPSRIALLAVLTLVLAVASTPPVLAATASPDVVGTTTTTAYTDGTYIVTFADEPVASYEGYLAGFPATRPQPGRKIDPASPAVQNWQQHLTGQHDAALAAVGAAKIYDYTITNNGVAAYLTANQAARLAKTPGVIALAKDQLAQPDTTLSPHFLGLDAAGGLWSQLGGAPHAGAGVVVGVIDTGIWPESAAFAGNTGIPVPADWHGKCVAGQLWSVNECNDKLIGARYYTSGFGLPNISTSDYRSARDGAGHGSHTTSTAAGNHGTTVTIDGNPIGTGSGMAPGAKVAAYKVCWEGRKGFPAGCFNSDSVAAINDAVLDGVDVLNYSIGGSSESSVLDSVAMAFRGASNAGVFVANSAGNSGPGASTLDHPAPWVTTVAAATFRRAFQAVELGNGTRYVGASTTTSLPAATRLVTAASVKLASATAADAARCFAGTLDPAKAVGKVVVCDRGVSARIDKSFEVKRAGGVGMVLANVSPNSLNGDYHAVPSVHVDEIAGAAIKAYITAAGAAATAKIVPLTAAELLVAPQVPEITTFSSRGPSTTTGGDILKPDIAAPGNDVVAAVAPPTNHGRNWDFMSGTSMSSPHIAGIGALLKAKHPTWLPSEIKSAIMTSATDTVSSANDPFAQGAGFVNPNGAADPGLVYPTTNNEYRQYLVGLGVHFSPPFDTLTPISGSNLNQASIGIGTLAGVQTVTRRVKNVGTSTATYTASAALAGFTTTVSPASLTLASGLEGTFTVTFTRTSAALGAWATGSLTWTDGTHRVRAPIAVRPVVVAAPAEIHSTDLPSGSKQFSVTPGFTGTLTMNVSGLVGVTPVLDSVTTGAFDIDNPVADADTDVYHVTVAAGTVVARFSLDSADDTADLDLFVYKDGDLVDLSASGAADEQVTLFAPAAGTYDVYVNGFTTPGGSTSYGLSNFVVPATNVGNMTVTPNPVAVTIATPVTLTASWTGLDATKRWLGVISYVGADQVTLVSIR
ncbi:MAG TPA: S8 family serine peptidase [Candidatus Limnocylindria bacterium]|nr:S8 family serine peptidase [Candidatus Limnocylindria bacterium]